MIDGLGASGVPYFSQWESAGLAERFVDGSMRLADDPRWAASGARTPAEYQYWANKVARFFARRGLLVRN